jgi:acrylyl-CoA reductase (NADPH)/3-hydroxypropionyl-CoA dehydratase/3-hydroxypropionyl-CoA synthetase
MMDDAARDAAAFVRGLWQLQPLCPVEASHPLFILYTSGSTGKPKGIVHAHGGYLTGLCATTELVFAVQPQSDAMLVVATPGWITGQSYMIAAALLRRVPSVLLDGSPVAPPDRFAAVIARHRVTVLKAGSTFLRMLMTTAGAKPLQLHDLTSLRLGTFCAEPVNQGVHEFAQAHLTPNYINSYWATEHGGIVWSKCHDEQPLRPDTRSWPLPWILGDVMAPSGGDGDGSGGGRWVSSAAGEQGDVCIREHYPYLALTVWSSEGFGADDTWRGDLTRWSKYFTEGVGYLQGDAAIRHADGAYTFHGRSDEVRPPYAAMRVRVQCERARGGSCCPHLPQCRVFAVPHPRTECAGTPSVHTPSGHQCRRQPHRH